METSRTQNTKRNIIFSYVDSIVTLLFQFVSRSVIVRVLGEQYLGMSSLFQSVLQVLNMAELGFSSAIVFNMYKPLADCNTDAVCSLLNYYKKIYYIVSVVVLTVGIAISPFLPYFINGEPPEGINIHILYFLYLANTCVSYLFFAYKTALLNALQRLDLSKIAYTVANLIQYGLQIVSLAIFRNYYAFVFCMIVGTIFKNVFSAYVSKKSFPQYVCKGEVSLETKKDIMSRVKGLLVCNVSAITYTTFDSIIISTYIGLASVTIYNNYIVVFSGVTAFITLIRNAMQASVGNSVATETKEKNYKDMLHWQFMFSFIATYCVTCMVSLYQPFMAMWMGEKLMLPFHNVILIVLWFFISVIHNSFFLYLSGNGLWWEMRWPYILSTVTNLVLNLVFGKLVGITGIIVSTLISTVAFGLFWQCAIIFKSYFGKSTLQFHLRQLGYLIVCAICSAGAYYINSILNINGIMGLIIKLMVCTVVSFGIQAMFFFRTNEYSNAKKLVIKVLKR